MTVTKLANLVDPQVMADIISAQLENGIRFAPLARVDRTLVGQPGSTLTAPAFKYIGDATDVAEGAAIDVVLLEATSKPFTIKKAGKGVEITDEAVLSGLGDPIGEATDQLTLSITSKIDNDVLEALATTTLEYTAGTAWDLDTVSDALDIFADEDDEPKVLLINPLDASKLRKAVSGDWTRAGDLGDDVLLKGTYGEVLGAQVIRSNKLAEGTGYLVKEGAVAIYLKRDLLVEDARDIITKTTVVTADEHYGVQLYNEAKAIKITVTKD